MQPTPASGATRVSDDEAEQSPAKLLQTGQYEAVVSLLEGSATVATVELLASAMIELGRYGEAEAALSEMSEAPGFRSWNRLGEVLVLQGRSAEAEPLFAAAISRQAPDALLARLNLAFADQRRGRLDAAEEGFYELISAYNRRQSLTSEELTAVGRACQALGSDNHQLFQDALKAYDEAVAADPSALEPRVRLGELFLEKYDSTEARSSIQDVLQVSPHHAGALVVMAKILHFEGSHEALEVVNEALEKNPSLIPAKVLKAQLLLELEDYDAATAEARSALEINPEALDGLAVLAASYFLEGNREGFDAVTQQVLERNPRYAEYFNLLADAAVRNRMYREAADFAKRAVELDPKSWRGYGLDGLNLLRLGEIEAGQKKLEQSFEGDPYNVWIKNTLDLLDTFPQFESYDSPRFEFVIHSKEAKLLGPEMSRLAEEAYDALAKRYDYEPKTPLRVEVFPSHADFSVRTVGLAGLGALGVCFGPVIAVDSPSAREIGSFSWGSTLWHELAHTFTLEVSGHRVPRWLTEGLSVLEERRARPGWGDDIRPDFLRLLEDDELLGIAEINNGFVRPTYPEQIAHVYYQASLIAELLEDRFGFDKVRELLRGYGRYRSTAELFPEVFGLELKEFDELFFAHLKERFATPLQALGDPDEEPPSSPEEMAVRADERPGEFRAQLVYGTYLASEQRYDEAIPYLERAKGLFPEYAYEGNAYRLLAKIWMNKGETAKAAAELEAMLAINETDYRSHLELADLRAKLGDPRGEVEALERAVFIYPLEIPLHERAAKLYAQLGEPAGLIRARQAVLALEPADRAEAHYQLALAYRAGGERDQARRELLRALELAPTYSAALELLLDLHSGEG